MLPETVSFILKIKNFVVLHEKNIHLLLYSKIIILENSNFVSIVFIKRIQRIIKNIYTFARGQKSMNLINIIISHYMFKKEYKKYYLGFLHHLKFFTVFSSQKRIQKITYISFEKKKSGLKMFKVNFERNTIFPQCQNSLNMFGKVIKKRNNKK